jgi:hypothetical protein
VGSGETVKHYHEQDCVDYLFSLPFGYLVDAQKGAAQHRAEGDWKSQDQAIADLVETIIAFRLDQGMTS